MKVVMKRLVTWLLTISMVLGTLLAGGGVTAYAANTISLDKYVTETTLYLIDKDGNRTALTSPLELEYGSKVRLELKWKLNNQDDQIKNLTEEDTFSYTLPITFIDVSEDPLMDGTTEAGKFTVNGKQLTFHYNSAFLEDKNIEGVVRIDAEITGDNGGNGDGADIDWKFPGGAEYTGKVNKDLSGSNLEIAKAVDNSNLTWLENRKVTLTVTATGKNENVKVTDTLSNYLTLVGGVNKSSFTVDGVDDYSVSGSNPFEVDLGTVTDKTVTISYYVNADATALQKVDKADQWNEIWANNVKLFGNEATVSGNGKDYNTAKADVRADKTWISKSGTADGDTVTWTITVNAGTTKTNLNGSVLTDVFGDNVSRGDYVEGTLSGGPSDLTWDKLVEGYTFGNTTDSYTITFKTKATGDSLQYGTSTVKNKVELKTPDGTTHKGEQGVTVGKDWGVITKYCEPKSGTSSTINWTSKITVNAGSAIQDKTFKDLFDNTMTLVDSSVKVNGKTVNVTNISEDNKNGFTFTLDVEQSDEEQEFDVTYQTKITSPAVGSYSNKSYFNSKDASASYSYKSSLQAVKTVARDQYNEGNQVWGTAENTDELTWTVKMEGVDDLKDSTKTLKLTDTLPKGLTYVENSAAFYYYEKGNTNAYVQQEIDAPEVTTVDGKTTLTFTIPTDYYKYYYYDQNPKITYKTKITAVSDERDNSNLVYANDAQWSLGDDKGPAGTATYYYNPQLLNKTHEYTDSTAPNVNYTVEVNPKGLDLYPDKDEYSIADTTGSALGFVDGSLKVTAEGGEEQAWTNYSYNDQSRTLTINGLKDSVHYTITYQCKVNITLGANEKFEDTNDGRTKNGVSFVTGGTISGWSNSDEIKGQQKFNSGESSNDKVSISIYKYKSGSEATALEGAEFKIYKVDKTVDAAGTVTVTEGATETLVSTMTTKADGKADSGKLDYDELYKLVETKAPSGYEIDGTYEDGIYFAFAGNGLQLSYPVILNVNVFSYGVKSHTFRVGNSESTTPKGEVEISKVDATSKEELPGAKLTITDKDGKEVASWTSESTTHKVQLAAGTYTLTETTAPEGYETAESIEFTVALDENDNVTVTVGGDTVSKVTMEDKQSTTPEPEEDTYKVVISKKAITGDDELVGASLKITTDAEGEKVVTGADDQQLSWISTETAKEVELAAGTYYLHETSAPEGYAVATAIRFTVTKTDDSYTVTRGDNVAVSNNTIVMKDAPVFEVEISKTDIGGEEISGATLEIHKGETAEGDQVASWESGVDGNDSNGKVKTHKVSLVAGTYTLVEKTAPQGYETAESITFTVDDNGVVKVGDDNKNGKITMEDKYSDQTVEISKTDVDGVEIKGAELKVTDKDGKEVASWTSGDDGKNDDGTVKIHKITVQPGTYTLTETTAPNGYTKAESITFTVDHLGKVQVNGTDAEGNKVKMVDGTQGKVTIKKTDVAGNEIEGAALKITDENGKEIESWTSEANKSHEVTLDAGTYTLTETTAPDGYEKAESITFTVDNNGEVKVNGEEAATVTMVDKYSDQTVEISKTDVAGKEIEGAELTITHIEMQEDGTEMTVTDKSWKSGEDGKDEDGKVKTHKVTLQPGTYTLTETTAPKGYKVAESITFTVDKNGKVTVNGKDQNGKLTMKDAYDEREITISKRDIADSAEVEGAYLTVTGTDDKVIDKWTSAKDGGHKISYAWDPNKVYTLTEVTTPDGYGRIVSTAITFQVSLEGTVTVTNKEALSKKAAVVEGNTVLVLNNQVVEEEHHHHHHDDEESSSIKPTTTTVTKTGGSVALVKTDSVTGLAVAGASFNLYTSKAVLVGSYTTDTYGIIRVDALDLGSYYFLETAAPEGYELNTWQQVFTLTAADTAKTPQIVSVAEVPTEKGIAAEIGTEVGGATGDSSNMMAYGATVAVAVILLAVWFAMSRKNANVR